jgi:peptide-methionine (S)-S-oxide reductase
MELRTLIRPGKVLAALVFAGLLVASFSHTGLARQKVPDPAQGQALAKSHGSETAVFAGGCFWGIEAVFEHVRGVRDARSGYAGGVASTAKYGLVSDGDTGHAESVEVTFDPALVSYGTLLKVFFSVAHDPTQLNRQGPDRGTQYRSAIFYRTPEQQKTAQAYVRQMTQAKVFGNAPIVTQITPLRAFFPAEAYHQDFARLNPNHPYIAYWDAPKVAHLQREFPGLYQAQGLASK